jgi:hypothetical protein
MQSISTNNSHFVYENFCVLKMELTIATHLLIAKEHKFIVHDSSLWLEFRHLTIFVREL